MCSRLKSVPAEFQSELKGSETLPIGGTHLKITSPHGRFLVGSNILSTQDLLSRSAHSANLVAWSFKDIRLVSG